MTYIGRGIQDRSQLSAETQQGGSETLNQQGEGPLKSRRRNVWRTITALIFVNNGSITWMAVKCFNRILKLKMWSCPVYLSPSEYLTSLNNPTRGKICRRFRWHDHKCFSGLRSCVLMAIRVYLRLKEYLEAGRRDILGKILEPHMGWRGSSV